jgi:hypothetical protein
MVNIPPTQMVMTGGWFIIALPTLVTVVNQQTSLGGHRRYHSPARAPRATGADAIDGGAEPPEVVFQAPTQHLLGEKSHWKYKC